MIVYQYLMNISGRVGESYFQAHIFSFGSFEEVDFHKGHSRGAPQGHAELGSTGYISNIPAIWRGREGRGKERRAEERKGKEKREG